MSYARLPFAQYFIDTSLDFNHTGRASRPLTYEALVYPCQEKLHRLLGIRHEVNFEIHWEPERDVIQLNFEKTCGLTDWLANVVEFGDKYYDAIEFDGAPLQLRVHGGWGAMYVAAKREIRARWQALQAAHPEAATEIVGWSLGSGLAMLCAQDLNFNFGVRPFVYSFGSVRPFRSDRTNDAAMRRYLSGVCTACWNFADCNDVITYMPPFRGFMAIRRVELRAKKRNVFRLMNPWRYHTLYDNEALYAEISPQAGE